MNKYIKYILITIAVVLVLLVARHLYVLNETSDQLTYYTTDVPVELLSMDLETRALYDCEYVEKDAFLKYDEYLYYTVTYRCPQSSVDTFNELVTSE